MIISPEEREAERFLFDAERKRVPDLFLREPMIDDDYFLRWIGIEDVLNKRPIGYLKLLPQDFIVEEISRDGIVHDIKIGDLKNPVEGEGLTYYADLVKIGVSTLEAKTQLAELLGIDEKNIGYAGIKDRLALTSQVISMRGIADPAKILSVNSENFFLKNLKRGKGVIANGELQGNRFTITLRTAEPIGSAAKGEMEQKLVEIKEDGFWNFFYFQRFGTPRLLSHVLGLQLVKGEYEGVVKTFLTYPGVRELPYFKNIREEIRGLWGNWRAIKEKIDLFPYHFHLERSFIDYLVQHPDDFLGALHTLPDQVRLWMYAYDCYLFNRKLSELIRAGSVPLSLPFITSFNPMDWKPYREFLETDGVKMPSRSYRDFPFIRVESRKWPTLQHLDIHNAVFEDRLSTFCFSLPKGSYATTFLMNFFELASGLPIVPGIFTESVDALKLLDAGSLEPILERFKTVLDRRQADLEGSMEE
jgi:TruD family tRNA pseudouridine synthase